MHLVVLQVPVRVAGGLLFELTGHSIGDPNRNEEDVPVVFRSWHSQNFLITSMHVKGTVDHLNVLGVMEVQVLHPRLSAHIQTMITNLSLAKTNNLKCFTICRTWSVLEARRRPRAHKRS